MLPDITEQYEEKPFHYTRRPVEEDPPLDVIAECHLCGVLLTTFEDVHTYNGQTFCSHECVDDYNQLMEE